MKAISLTCTIFCSTRFPSSNRLHCLTEIPAYDTQLRQNMAISTGLWSTFLSQRSWLLCCWNSSRLGCPVHAQFLLLLRHITQVSQSWYLASSGCWPVVWGFSAIAFSSPSRHVHCWDDLEVVFHWIPVNLDKTSPWTYFENCTLPCCFGC